MPTTIRAAAILLLLCPFLLAIAASSRQSTNLIPAPGSPFAAGNRPNALAVADVNGDGFPDLLSANAGDQGVGVLLGDGRGSFRAAPGSPFSAVIVPHLLATGDFDGNGKTDVAVTSHDSNAVTVLLGDGVGVFKQAPGSPFAAFSNVKPHNHGLAAGDLNGDDKSDLTLGHQDEGAIAVLLGDGRGAFSPAPGSPVRLGRGFYPHALGDINGDKRLDIVAPDIMGNAIVVALGDGRGGFTAAAGSPLQVKSRPYFVLLTDVNGDGRRDVMATHDDMDDVDVFVGDGRGGLTPTGGFRAGHRGWTMATPDLNADGRMDLVIAGMAGLKAFTGDGKGGFAPAVQWSVKTARPTWQVATADFNRDGKADLAYPDADAGTVAVMLGQ